MEPGHAAYVNSIHMIFEKYFGQAYLDSNARRRARLIPHVSTIYRRWLYSAIVEETLLTPANLIEACNRMHGCCAESMPAAFPRSAKRFSGVGYEMVEYSRERHPVVADLRIAVEFCKDPVELYDDDGIEDSLAMELAGRLSLRDPHYAAYLTGVAVRMGLVEKLPSIYANRAQTAKHAASRLKSGGAALFGEIVEATIQNAAFNLIDLIPLPEPVFGEKFVRSILKKPMETDDIFQKAYDLLGLTIDDVVEMGMEAEDSDEAGEDGFNALNAAFLSGTYMMGIALDRYFFAPFGYYLKLIRPLYILPFNFEREIKYFLEAAFDDEELNAAFFAPCSQFYLTDIGLEHFGVKPDSTNYVDVKKQLPYEALKKDLIAIMASFYSQPDYGAWKPEAETAALGMVMTFRVVSEFNQSVWMDLEIPANATLHRLYQEIMAQFSLNPCHEYSFFAGETESPFCEYKSKSGAHGGRTSAAKLDELDFERSGKLILAVSANLGRYGGSKLKYFLRLRETKQREPRAQYPLVARWSKRAREIFAVK